MYEFLGITLVLAMLLTVNAVATAAATGLWHLFRRPLLGCSARTRAELLFVMRIGPPTIAIVWSVAFIIPSYLFYEPHSTDEFVSLKLGTLAAMSAVGVGCAVWRGIRSTLATRSLLKMWVANAVRIEFKDLTVPAYRLMHTFPIIAVVGTFRPRLFISAQVLKILQKNELAATIVHEYGHMAAHDNLKRSLLRASRAALLIIPCGRSLDRAWGEASESAADEHAGQDGASVAVNLTSALVRIARLVPQRTLPLLPPSVSTFLNGREESHGVKGRVGRLLELAGNDSGSAQTSAEMVRVIPWFVFVCVILLSLTIESRPQVLASVHLLI